MTSKDMKPNRAIPIEDRIKQIRADIDAIIDVRVQAVARENPGVPSGVIRNLLIAHAPTCACAQYLGLDEVQRK